MPSVVVSLLLLSLIIGHASATYKHVIYVDYTDGVLDSKCWLGEIDQPCKTFSLAREGKKVLKDAVVAILQHEPVDNRYNVSSLESDEQSCPPWMFRDESGICKCGTEIDNSVDCKSTKNKTSLLVGYCMTRNENRETELGRCFFGCNYNFSYRLLPDNSYELNNFMCGKYNRSNTLCGKCKDGFSPLVYSYEMNCMNCTNTTHSWAKYVAVAFAPLTLFYFFVVLFKFSGTSPQLRAFIFVVQAMASPLCIRNTIQALKDKPIKLLFIKLLGCIYGIWNLDFFRPILPHICLTITPLQALALDYVVAFYPLLLVALTYTLIHLHSRDVGVVVWLWRPLHKCFTLVKVKWDLKGSVVNAFATFFLLTYVKLLNVTFDLLVFSTVYTMNETSYTMNETSYTERKVLYFDGTVEYFGKEHLPYAIIALIVLIIFIFLPLVLLTLYPMRWFQKCLNCICARRHILETFINCFQGYYKDGTNGTKDCRYFSISFFLIQMVILGFFAVTRSVYILSFGAVILIIFTVIVLVVQPYKAQFKAYTLTDTMLMLGLACTLVMGTASDEANMKASNFKDFSYVFVGLFASVPVVYLVTFSVWWILVDQRFGSRCCLKIKSWLRKDSHNTIETEDLPHRLQNPKTYERLLSNPNAATNDYGSINKD